MGVPTATAPLYPTVLPPGVHDVPEWGRTIIRFGKTHTGKTYQSVATDPQLTSYRRWVLTHAALPAVVDFKLYLLAVGHQGPKPTSAGALILGTTIPREQGAGPCSRIAALEGALRLPDY